LDKGKLWEALPGNPGHCEALEDLPVINGFLNDRKERTARAKLVDAGKIERRSDFYRPSNCFSYIETFPETNKSFMSHRTNPHVYSGETAARKKKERAFKKEIKEQMNESF